MSNAYHKVFGYLIPALIGIVGANMQGTTERLLETHTTNIWSFLIATAIYCYACLAHQENSSQAIYCCAYLAHQENSSQAIYCYAYLAHQENSSQAIYCYAYLAHQENSSQSAVSLASTFVPRSDIGHMALVAVVSGSVSAVSLISTFVPRSDIGHIILYTAWLCSSITIVVHQYGALFTEACRPLYNRTLKPFCSQLYNQTLKPFCINICSRFQSNDTSSAGQQQPTLPV